MCRKQRELRDVLDFGGSHNPVLELTSQLAEAAERMHKVQAVHVDSKSRPILHQCGYDGCRVGEASNPGQVQTRSAKLRTTQPDSDPEQVVTGGRYAVLSGDSDDERPTIRVPGSSVDLLERDIRVDSACGPGSVPTKQCTQEVAPLEMDMSHPFHDDRASGATTEHELECVHISAGDVGDGAGLAVVERAADAHSHECARVAEFAEAQTRLPSRLVLVETQYGGVA